MTKALNNTVWPNGVRLLAHTGQNLSSYAYTYTFSAADEDDLIFTGFSNSSSFKVITYPAYYTSVYVEMDGLSETIDLSGMEPVTLAMALRPSASEDPAGFADWEVIYTDGTCGANLWMVNKSTSTVDVVPSLSGTGSQDDYLIEGSNSITSGSNSRYRFTDLSPVNWPDRNIDPNSQNILVGSQSFGVAWEVGGTLIRSTVFSTFASFIEIVVFRDRAAPSTNLDFQSSVGTFAWNGSWALSAARVVMFDYFLPFLQTRLPNATGAT